MTAPEDGGVCEVDAAWRRQQAASRFRLPAPWFVQGMHNRGVSAHSIAVCYGASVADVEAALGDTGVAEVA